jgi:predicted dehydrogenase
MPFIAERLIKENVGFMMEKPAGVDSPKIKKLADLAEKKKVFVAIALVGRITPMVTQLAKWRDKAELGDFTHLCMRYIAGPPDRYIKGNSEWMLDKNQAGGGCTINLAVHFVDMFIYLTGKKVKSVFAKMSSLVHNKGIEDSSTIVLASEDSTIGTIETGYTRPTAQAEYCAFCTTKSYITSAGLFESGIMEREDREGQKIEIKCHSQNNVYFEFIKSTLNSFRSGDKPIANLKDMYEVMRVVDMAYESNLKNKVMILGE